ncbi:pentatricopeptide repeat-containing protein At1g33350-like [Telopea speciosissima]|uniref:pentatricopeptide repeat-containing protein At1g33350-like n=1 Tax=Telopea speciosissima TaxID=54955 RepID=UPI001CC44157|nr:pentatricopeptide repeat-containing protein At1g33350-like [Telopea speciosissima]
MQKWENLAGKENQHTMHFASPQVPSERNLNKYVLYVLDKCNHLKQLQAFLLTLGHGHTPFYAFKLVRFCAVTIADFDYARFIFDHVHSPNVYLYTAMITAYASKPDHRSAILLFRTMIRRGRSKPNHFIYPQVLKSSSEISETQGTKSIHSQILRSGFGGYPIVQTALLDSYSRLCLDLGAARELFDKMSERNVVSWTAMISAYARLGQIGNAILLFEDMPERDIPSWNAVIAGCTQNGLFTEAISLLRRMIVLAGWDERPNQVTVVCALSACGHLGMLQLGKWIHGYIYRNHLGPNSFVSNGLVDMYGKCGSLKEARRVFDETSDRSLTSWNSMINSLALHGQSESAIAVFEEMIDCGGVVHPDGITFVGLLNACTHGGLVEEGCNYFISMTRDYGIEPQIEHYGCVIDLLGRAGRFKEAMEVIRRMNIEPDEVVWGSLVNGCKIHRCMDLAEFAIQRLIDIDPHNAGYVMLANIYGESGNWEEMRKVRKMLQEKGVAKMPGCSWIEIDNKVHQFYSADKMHPGTEEIYRILESLVNLY